MISPNLIEVICNVANSKLSPPDPPPPGSVPNVDDLRGRLTNDPTKWKSYIATYIIGSILPISGEVSPPITKLMRRPKDIPNFKPRDPINLPPYSRNKRRLFPTVRFLDYKLFGTYLPGHNDLEQDIQRGFAAVSAFDPNDPNTLPNMTTQDEAIQLVKDLRAFQGYVSRIAISQRVAAATGRPLAEVLALYRQEGELAVPSSTDSLANELPTIEQSLRNPSDDNIKANLSTGVWIMELEDFKTETGLGATDPDPPPDYIKISALLDFFLLIGGADFLTRGLRLPEYGPETRDPDDLIEKFAKHSADYWQDSGLDGDPQAAIQRFKDMFAYLTLQPVQGAPTLLRLAPSSPVLLTTSILTECICFLNSARVPQDLKYLAYNARAHGGRNDQRIGLDAGYDPFQQIMVSALHAAKATNDPTLAPSLDKIQFPVGENTGVYDYQAVVDSLKSNNWFIDPTHEANLVTFISTADQKVWTDWYEFRANLSCYNILLNYYTQLTA